MPLFGAHPVEQRAGLLVIAMVDTHGDALTTGGRHGGGGFVDGAGQGGVAGLFRAPGDIDDAAMLAERGGNALARASAGAGDDRDLGCLAHPFSP